MYFHSCITTRVFLAHIHQNNTEREHDNFLLLIQEEIAMLLIFREQLHFILPLHQLFVPIPDFQYFIYASKNVIIPANVELVRYGFKLNILNMSLNKCKN